MCVVKFYIEEMLITIMLPEVHTKLNVTLETFEKPYYVRKILTFVISQSGLVPFDCCFVIFFFLFVRKKSVLDIQDQRLHHSVG